MKKTQIQTQNGFTLIELIIVIVILGILAVTAAPRFIDISSDASRSVLQGVKGALVSGNQLARAQGLIEGVDITQPLNDSQDIARITINGQWVTFNRGHVWAEANTINRLLEIDATVGRENATDQITTDFLMLNAFGPQGNQGRESRLRGRQHLVAKGWDQISTAVQALIPVQGQQEGVGD